MALDINTIKPASLKAKNVATEEYVDTSVANIDISNTLNTNNNVFAQRLGYMDYADMVAAAESGQTIINGGYLRGELIEANSINAGQIDAYAISGKTITGGTINGSVINGVQINGAIIKGSFIDYTTSLALTNWQYYKPLTAPIIPVENITITSWSYSVGIITCNVTPGTINNSSFIKVGNTVDISNLTSTTNPPNGTRTITEISASGNNFKVVVINYPTGTPSVSGSSKVTSRHEDNFAHNNDGSLVVDSLGYVRLPGQQNFIVGNVVKSGRATYSVHAIDAVYDLYSWNSYKINTLQRSVRQDTQFSSSALLKITANGEPAHFSTTNNWGFSVHFTFLNITYVLSVSAYSSNAHTSAQTHLYANGVEVAGAVGSLGTGLNKPWDSGWIDYNTTVKGIPINVKSEIQYGPISIEISIPISTLTPIVNHDVDDIIKVDSISGYSNPGSNSFYVDYNINFPTIFVV